MRQIVVISGKGGTGKTVVAASFASFAANAVLVDGDVDASNLPLLLHPRVRQTHPFETGQVAVLDEARCTACGRCAEVCRFGAISRELKVDPLACEGCGLCGRVCPAAAIRMQKETNGAWFVSETDHGPLVHARLEAGAENSGKLVTRVRKAAREIAERENRDIIIIDGPPGIGCPVMASLSGTDMAVVVTEPTLSGWHDARRVIRVAEHFRIGACVVINRYDLNEEVCREIQDGCAASGIPVIGRIAFDPSVVACVVAGRIPGQAASAPVRRDLEKIWEAAVENMVSSKG